MKAIEIVISIIVVLLAVAISLMIWETIGGGVSISASTNIDDIVSGLAIIGYKSSRNRSKKDFSGRKKGIQITANLLAMLVFIVVVASVIILIWLSTAAEAGGAASDFFYGIFDSIIRSLPWVN